MKAHCLQPWTNIDISPRGEIRPCCKFKINKNLVLNIETCSLDQYRNSDFLNDIKSKMLQGEWHEGCVRCKIEEDNNIKSMRQLEYKRLKTHYDNYTEDKGFITAGLSFGNTCNLKCITCGSSSSSRWRKEYLDIYGEDIKPIEVTNYTVDNLYNNLPNAIYFTIGGGEPLLSEVEKQNELLDKYIASGQSREMDLHYTTNAMQFPNDNFWNKWKHFKTVDIQLSIDGFSNKYEYIRFPASYSKLEQIIKQYLQKQQEVDNLKISISHTVSAYNIYYLDEFFTWCKNIGLPTPWCGAVYEPKYMRPTLFPSRVKSAIVNKLRKGKHIDILRWSKIIEDYDDSEYFEDFLKYRDKHDIYRNLSFAKTFPEVEDLINGI